MSRSICILYGLNEGPAIGQKFATACEQAGFSIVQRPETADIIFAHSGGYLLIPAAYDATLVAVVGLSYWPGRPWIVCTSIKVWREWNLYRVQHRIGEWARKWANHARYSLNLRDTVRMAANLGSDRLWNGSKPQVIIRNRYDAYCTPDIHTTVPFYGPRTFISLPGEHDDCWDNPEPYVNLLQLLYGAARAA